MSDENDIEESEDEMELEAGDDDYVLDASSSATSAPTDYLVDESVALRESLRQQIQSDVEAFLARGGVIHEIPANIVSDPPRKPQNSYGGQPI